MRKRKRPGLNTSLLLVGLLVAFCTAQAQQLTQYAHTAWRLQEGAFDASPVAIAQTTDGFLWIGTLNGLVRSDGVHFESGSDRLRWRQINYEDPMTKINRGNAPSNHIC
jgi:ligand-binding sensor domain-containing protein